jgi:hypothetical protein
MAVLRNIFIYRRSDLHGDDSDVVLNIPPGAIETLSGKSADESHALHETAGVAFHGSICTDLRTVHEQLNLEGHDRICSPVAEYFAGENFKFQKPVCINLPHFLSEDIDEKEIKVYQFHKQKSGKINITTLKPSTAFTRADESEDGASDEGYYVLDKAEIKVFTSHFSGYFCTHCKRKL